MDPALSVSPRQRLAAGGSVAAIALVAVLAGNSGAVTQTSKAATNASTASTSGSSNTVGSMPKTAILHVDLSTTSDWTSVQLGVPWVVDFRTRSLSSGATLTTTSGGWVIKGPASGSKVSIDAVVTLPTSNIGMTVQKGNNGVATATVTAGSTTPVSVTDSLHSSPDNAYGSLPLASATASPLVTKQADTRKLVLAFAYPWFSNYDNSQLADTPSDPRSMTTADGELSEAQQARANGVDGFIMSWEDESHTGSAYNQALAAADQTGGLLAPYLEVGELQSAGANTDATLQAAVLKSLKQVLTRSSDPATLTSGGVPVVFAFSTSLLSATGWANVTSSLSKAGTPIKLVGDVGGSVYPSEWGIHSYAATDTPQNLANHWQGTAITQRAADALDGTSHLVTATVSPGYNDTKLRGTQNAVVPRDSGNRYDLTWQAALSSNPDWILVTSWNEWFEDTQIEPGVNTGSQALSQTQTHAASWKAGS